MILHIDKSQVIFLFHWITGIESNRIESHESLFKHPVYFNKKKASFTSTPIVLDLQEISQVVMTDQTMPHSAKMCVSNKKIIRFRFSVGVMG